MFESERKIIQDKICQFLKELGCMSIYAQQAMSVFQQVAKLEPILSEIGNAVISVDYDVFEQFQIQFRKITQQLNSCDEQIININQHNNVIFQFKEMINTMKKIAEQLQSILQNIHSITKRQIIWVDVSGNRVDSNIPFQLKDKFKNSLKIKFFTNVDDFKAGFQYFISQTLYLILHCQFVNNQAHDLFNWLKYQQKLDKINIRIKGILIYTNEIEVKKNIDIFMNDKSKLVRCVTSDTKEITNILNQMISPSNFCRIVDISEFSLVFTKKLKDKLLQINIEEREHKRLTEYHPNLIKLEKIFKDTEQFLKNNKINLDTNSAKFNEVLKHILDIYKQNKDDRTLAGALIYLYSRQDVQFYKLINSILNTLNERLLEVFYPVIEMFAFALYFYDDSSYPEQIKLGKDTLLYRGYSIPIEQYNDLFQVNNLITFPAFSSLTPDVNVAINSADQTNFSDTKPCVFVYTQSFGSKQHLTRPKYITNHVYFKTEKEFITYPFISYKIDSIIPKKHKEMEYDEIRLIQI